jgi:hypothetical protein
VNFSDQLTGSNIGQGKEPMSSRHNHRGGAGLALLAGLILASLASAQNCDCQKDCCPPYFKYRYEGPPKIKFKHGCPKPICDPCYLPHYGYYQACWAPWPFPPEWTHCPVPPPAALVVPIPPKRFRGEPVEDKDKDKDRQPTSAPEPRRLEGSAAPQFLPIPTTGQARDMEAVKTSNMLPSRDGPQLMPSGPGDGKVNQDAHSDPSPAAPLQPVPSVPQVIKPVEQPIEKHDTPVIAPMDYKTTETPAPLPPSLAARVTDPKPADSIPAQAFEKPATPGLRLVNSHRIMLDYDMKDVPSADGSILELWYTQDGKRWFKDETTVKSGSPYVIEVNKEGTYGFMMVARERNEKSVPPAAGETPQVWVEVDWTRPVVSLVDAKMGKGPLGRSVALTWTATDSNLTKKPINLYYAEKSEGPWKSFAIGLENTGHYIWQVPETVPANVFVRMEACDSVGNIGSAQTVLPVQMP